MQEWGRSRALPSPDLQRQPGRPPVSGRFDDVYYSPGGGLAEARSVFLEGCGFPDAWHGADTFTVGELGFGTGLNFLACWELWRRTRKPGARLHYIAVEGYPLTPEELAACLEPWPELQPLSRNLLRVYPPPQPGFHRLFPVGEVFLTLLCGEAASVLAQAEAQVDAWFLDGFTPEKNPAMWSAEVFTEVARLSHLGARLASYSVAGEVRRGLETVGFETTKAPGFGHKREMLRARFREGAVKSSLQPWFARPPSARTGHAAIVGGGIAGASVARALHRRGWHTTIFERRSTLADEASGNPAVVLMPRLTAAPNLDGRFYAAAWRYLLAALDEIGEAGPSLYGDRGGLLQLATDDAEAARQAAIIAAAPLPAALLSHVNAAEASDIAACALPFGALYFPQGGWLRPRDFCAALARDSAVLLDAEIMSLRYNDGQWHLADAQGMTRAQADVVVLANAFGAASLPPTAWLALQARRGQITLAPPTSASAGLRSVLAYGGYITPVDRGTHSIGATFDWVDTQNLDRLTAVAEDDHARNLADLARVLPSLMAGSNVHAMSGRAGIRCTTLDHMPVAGPVPDQAAYLSDFAELRHGHPWARYPVATYQPGLFILTGLGARGMVAAPLAAEIVAAQITGEPWPVERDLVTALHPGRFLVRDLKRRDA